MQWCELLWNQLCPKVVTQRSEINCHPLRDVMSLEDQSVRASQKEVP